MKQIALLGLAAAMLASSATSGFAEVAPNLIHPQILKQRPMTTVQYYQQYQQRCCQWQQVCVQYAWCWRHFLPGGQPFLCCQRAVNQCVYYC